MRKTSPEEVPPSVADEDAEAMAIQEVVYADLTDYLDAQGLRSDLIVPESGWACEE